MHPHLVALHEELGISRALLITRGLLAYGEAECLEVVERGADGREHLLLPMAASAWRALRAAAVADGITLFVVSAFRSIERQAEIVRRKLEGGMHIEAILAVSAPPGYSEHHTGRAVDVSTPGVPTLEVEFDRTPAFAWLSDRGSAFGFHLSYPVGNPQGYQYEPWHWCFHHTAH